MPLLFAFPECSRISKGLCDLPAFEPGRFSVTRYENQEFHAAVHSRVAGELCFLLGSITPPEYQMFSFLLLGHTLKKEGASRITGILPYVAYSREDKPLRSGNVSQLPGREVCSRLPGLMRYGPSTCTANRTNNCSPYPWNPFLRPRYFTNRWRSWN